MAPDLHDKCKNQVIFCCLSMGPEGRADLVRLLECCGYGMSTVLLRQSLMVKGIEDLTLLFPTKVR